MARQREMGVGVCLVLVLGCLVGRVEGEDCVEEVRGVAELCEGVLASSSPFDLLNCCEGAQEANERKCFCESGVALALGTSYDATLEVLRTGCSLDMATYGSVECHTHTQGLATGEVRDTGGQELGASSSGKLNPVSVWALNDEVDSNIASDRMNNVNGLYSAEVDLGYPGPSDQDSSAFFSGLNSYVLVPYSPLLNTADFTISATVKPQGKEGQDREPDTESIVENFAETSQATVIIGGYGLERHWVGPNEEGSYEPIWAFAVGTPVGPLLVYSKSKAFNDEWAQVVGTYSSRDRTARLYVNGELEGSDSLGNQIMLGNPENDMLVGNGNRLMVSGETTTPYVGYISQVAFFDTPLDQQEIDTLYERSFPPKSKGAGLPLWAIILIGSLCCIIGLGVFSVVFVWKFRKARENSNNPSAQSKNPTTANEAPGAYDPAYGFANNRTPLKEDMEQLTPKGSRKPSAEVHPRFKKIGSRISVTWN
ncbi:putative concanavalin A-like lectin/glucanase [Chloropicon primus]|uniref:Putative concanavalin A-like lectin/glucanase n=1 Tax=Chloropicon primus TaxID=1764295 RepID=A0A5B8MAP0_9CHLO|nr:putative concanavalin A-like lectin/glucanase [Chloropicon primus]UPQ96728.1 putative concanavalin A-like lectin/glucanase [Chloropicon primus]|eukprot:QDZ17508.1 putative concanavalin A-like lectin/glucanase [Chloropicon primus]